MKRVQSEGDLQSVAEKAGMEWKRVRKYPLLDDSFSEGTPRHSRRMRKNGFEGAGGEVRDILPACPPIDDRFMPMDTFGEDYIFLADRTRSIRFTNVSSQSGPGRSSEAVFEECDLRGFGEAMGKQIETVFETGRPLSVELSTGKAARKIWYHTRLTPVRNESGTIHLVLGIARDISELKRREKQIETSRDEWLRVIDAMPHLMAVVGPDFQIRKANKTLASYLGINVREMQGRICHETFGGECPSEFCPLRWSRVTGKQATNFVHSIQGRPFLATVSALAGETKEMTGCLFVARDLPGRIESTEGTKKNAEELKLVIRRADYVIMMQDESGKYLSICALPGNMHLPGEIAGKTPFDFFEAETAAELCGRVRKAIRDGRDFSVHRELKLAGETFHLLDYVQLVRDAAGNITSVMTTSKNITPRREESGEIACEMRGLTKRETEILQLISSGLSSSEIAAKLFISRKTAETHRSRIMQKLDIHKASALARYAVQAGLS